MSFRRPLSLTALLAIVMALTIFPARRPSPLTTHPSRPRLLSLAHFKRNSVAQATGNPSVPLLG